MRYFQHDYRQIPLQGHSKTFTSTPDILTRVFPQCPQPLCTQDESIPLSNNGQQVIESGIHLMIRSCCTCMCCHIAEWRLLYCTSMKMRIDSRCIHWKVKKGLRCCSQSSKQAMLSSKGWPYIQWVIARIIYIQPNLSPINFCSLHWWSDAWDSTKMWGPYGGGERHIQHTPTSQQPVWKAWQASCHPASQK